MSKVTHLGRFLRSLRIERGYTNVTQYLRKYKLPISDVYYRDLEAGRKMVGLENAGALCSALQADLQTYYFYLLKDLLPEQVIQLLVRPVVDDTFESIDEKLAEQNRTHEVYRTVLMQHYSRQVLSLNEEAIAFFKQNFELLPILYFIYSLNGTNEREIGDVAKRNSVSMPASQIISQFERLGLVAIVSAENGSGPRKIRRLKPAITFSDDELLNKCILWETQKSLSQPRNKVTFEGEGAFVYQGLSMIAKDSHKHISRRIMDLITEIRAADIDLLSTEAEPFHYSIIVSTRPEYGMPGKDDNK